MSGELTIYQKKLEEWTPRLDAAIPKMAEALPEGCDITPQRFARIALSTLTEQSGLLDCSVSSVLGGIFTSAEVGLELGVAGQCWMIPFRDKHSRDGKMRATFITGYLGTLLLAAAYLAIGSFFSSLTRNQVIAFVLSVVACAVFLFAGSTTVMSFLSTFLPDGLVRAIDDIVMPLLAG